MPKELLIIVIVYFDKIKFLEINSSQSRHNKKNFYQKLKVFILKSSRNSKRQNICGSRLRHSRLHEKGKTLFGLRDQPDRVYRVDVDFRKSFVDLRQPRLQPLSRLSRHKLFSLRRCYHRCPGLAGRKGNSTIHSSRDWFGTNVNNLLYVWWGVWVKDIFW